MILPWVTPPPAESCNPAGIMQLGRNYAPKPNHWQRECSWTGNRIGEWRARRQFLVRPGQPRPDRDQQVGSLCSGASEDSRLLDTLSFVREALRRPRGAPTQRVLFFRELIQMRLRVRRPDELQQLNRPNLAESGPSRPPRSVVPLQE